MVTILCIATYLKGDAFLRECRRQGCRVLLLTADSLVNAAWPREAIDEIHSVPRDADAGQYQRRVDAIARANRVDRIVALDDFDVETAAMLREHLQVPGMGRTTASRFRDKLAMRMKAREMRIPVPEFTAVFNDETVREWTARFTPPWVLKPRSSAAAIGIKQVPDHAALGPALHDAGDTRSNMLLEQFVDGSVYHVDSILWGGAVAFAVPFKYGRPPMEVAHGGGLFITKRMSDASDEGRALLDLNRRLQAALGLRRGVSHSEFIRRADGTFVFLETSARVGGAFIVDTIEAATGMNLWSEWAKIEIAGEDGEYQLPKLRRDCSGIILTLARQEEPDLSGYTDPEIHTRIRKPYHAGLIVASADAARVDALLDDYSTRFYKDFFATAPPPERPVE